MGVLPDPNLHGGWHLTPIPSPRTMPVNLPFPDYGVTIATLDKDGNVTIKVNQPVPEPVGERPRY
jgi:hypothetical protein